MQEFLKKIRVPLQNGEVREIDLPEAPTLASYLGQMKFCQLTLKEYLDLGNSVNRETLYFVHTPAGLLKIMLGSTMIWFRAIEELEYVPNEEFKSRSCILNYPSGQVHPVANPRGFPVKYDLSDHTLTSFILYPVDFLRVACTGMKQLVMSSDAPVVDLTALDTSGFVDMTRMCVFYQVTELDVSGFDTRYVSSMESMFWCCRNLKKLDLGHFDVSRVKSFKSMFEGCGSLESVNLGRWDINYCNDVRWMFKGCSSLKSQSIFWSNAFRFTTLEGMFQDCSSLTNLDLRNLNTLWAREEAYIRVFSGCSSLKTLDISNFDFIMNSCQPIDMFYRCTSLTNLTFGKNYSNVPLDLGDCPLTHTSAMSVINGLKECTKQTTLTFSSDTYATLTEEEIATATSLGFTLVAR